MAEKKYVYTFGGSKTEGEGAMKNLLGGKGANLAEMAKIGLPVPPDPFRASDAVAIKVADSEIGVYKYDATARFQRERIDRIAREKRLYIIGVPYPVKVYGSFVFFGLERNPAKRKILRTIEKFK